jgi:hypothetical protein
MKSAASLLATVFVSAAVCVTAIGVYDVMVRQPRTPRLALIDIAKLYDAADQGLKNRVLEGASGSATAASGASRGVGPYRLHDAGDFGPMLEAVLTDLSAECRCAIVAMATVVGGDSTVPDFTQETAKRMGLVLRAGTAR